MVDNWYYTKDIIDLCYTKYIEIHDAKKRGKITMVDVLRLWLSAFVPHKFIDAIYKFAAINAYYLTVFFKEKQIRKSK